GCRRCSIRIEPLAGYRHSGNEHAFQGARASKDSSPMKIAIVEDERLFRDVLRKACTMHLGHEVVGEAGSGREALLVVPAALPDLLVLDIHLPDMDGLDVLRFLRRKRALLKALLLSSYFDDYTLCRIEQATVQGFIDKSAHRAGAASGAGSASRCPTRRSRRSSGSRPRPSRSTGSTSCASWGCARAPNPPGLPGAAASPGPPPAAIFPPLADGTELQAADSGLARSGAKRSKPGGDRRPRPPADGAGDTARPERIAPDQRHAPGAPARHLPDAQSVVRADVHADRPDNPELPAHGLAPPAVRRHLHRPEAQAPFPRGWNDPGAGRPRAAFAGAKLRVDPRLLGPDRHGLVHLSSRSFAPAK